MQDSPLSSAIPDFDGAPTLQGFEPNNIQDFQVGEPIRTKSRQYVKFYRKVVPVVKAKKVKINEKTGQVRVLESEVVHVDKEFVCIVTPGDKNVFDNIATEIHKREFWEHYQAFRDGRTAPVGKDLDECEYVPSSVVTEMKYLKCFTEEQLADASDLFCGRVPDGWVYREYARAMVKANRPETQEVAKLHGQLESANSVIAQMQAKMQELEAMILDQNGDPIVPVGDVPKKRGRPKNVEV